jgi:hypothetical protein
VKGDLVVFEQKSYLENIKEIRESIKHFVWGEHNTPTPTHNSTNLPHLLFKERRALNHTIKQWPSLLTFLHSLHLTTSPQQ